MALLPLLPGDIVGLLLLDAAAGGVASLLEAPVAPAAGASTPLPDGPADNPNHVTQSEVNVVQESSEMSTPVLCSSIRPTTQDLSDCCQ